MRDAVQQRAAGKAGTRQQPGDEQRERQAQQGAGQSDLQAQLQGIPFDSSEHQAFYFTVKP
jgi:hypothetical protein